MTKPVVETVAAAPYLDMELFMGLSQAKRLDGKLFEAMTGYWERWLEHLQVRRITVGKNGYLLAWLEREVERDVDNAWEESPADAFLVGCLAQSMIMVTLRSLVPEVEEAGCAPAPKPPQALREALVDLGVANLDGSGLARQYAILTHFPYKGGCEICILEPQCPKTKAEPGYKSMILGLGPKE